MDHGRAPAFDPGIFLGKLSNNTLLFWGYIVTFLREGDLLRWVYERWEENSTVNKFDSVSAFS